MTDHTQTCLNLHETDTLDSVEEYHFEPIKGYPMLHWYGKHPFTSTQYSPAQLKEVHGPEVDGWHSKIYWGDNLQVLSHLLREYRGRIQLVYIDPPFDSKADYKTKIRVRGEEIRSDQSAFEEKQYTDLWRKDEHLQFMYERVILLRELLADNGTIYVHVDASRGHQLRCILDEVFGPGFFRNEIIWHYENKLGTGGQTVDSHHDTLLVYTKGKDWTHNPIMVPVKETKMQPVTQKIDGKRVWLRDEEGNRLYQESSVERPLGDVWTIPIINPMASERIGYPTQKPEKLLEYIIQTSSNLGDLIFDCFMGSGTTQAVAMKLGRRFIGADINLGAVQITTKRLIKIAEELEEQQRQDQQAFLPNSDNSNQTTIFFTGFEVYNVNYYDIFRNPVEAKDLLLEALEVHRLTAGHLFDGEKDGRLWKIMPVNRITTRADLNELITNFDYKAFQRRYNERPGQPVEKITLVCMGHEPDLAAVLKKEVHPYILDVEVVDILRDKQELQFKRDSEAFIQVKNGSLVIDAFYPMNLLSKLSLQKERVDEWRELVESVMIDWNFDGAILQPTVVDVPDTDELVSGRYPIPPDTGTIRVKITDLLSESLEMEVHYG